MADFPEVPAGNTPAPVVKLGTLSFRLEGNVDIMDQEHLDQIKIELRELRDQIRGLGSCMLFTVPSQELEIALQVND